MTDFDTSPIIIEDSTPPSVRGERLTGRYGMVALVGTSLRSEAGVRDAIAKLTAWLDAPRLAARATAEVVAQDEVDGSVIVLLRTPFEWAARYVAGPDDAVTWYATERPARMEYAIERGKVLCVCGAEHEPCLTQAAFKAQRFMCGNRGNGYTEACGWTGTGADLDEVDTGHSIEPGCPKCLGAVEGVTP